MSDHLAEQAADELATRIVDLVREEPEYEDVVPADAMRVLDAIVRQLRIEARALAESTGVDLPRWAR